MTLKSIISDMLVGFRLNNANHDSWHQKIKYLLNENDNLKLITREIIPQSEIRATEVRWCADDVKKDHRTWYLMMSCMAEDIMHEFKNIEFAKEMWIVSKRDMRLWRKFGTIPFR